MLENKELLYEKIADISEKKSNLIEENKKLKKQLAEYQETIFEDFCEFVTLIVEKVDLDEGLFDGKSEEEKLARYFIRTIKDKAKEQNLDEKLIASKIVEKIKGL